MTVYIRHGTVFRHLKVDGVLTMAGLSKSFDENNVGISENKIQIPTELQNVCTLINDFTFHKKLFKTF